MTDEPENLILHQLRAIDAKIDKGFLQTVEAFERVYVELAEVKGEVMKCRADVAGADRFIPAPAGNTREQGGSFKT